MTIYAVTWNDSWLGQLSLIQPNADEAITCALGIALRGAGKVSEVRALMLTHDERLTVLIGPEV